MSGGSFGYLFSTLPLDVEALVSKVQAITKDIEDSGFPVAAKESEKVITLLQQVLAQAQLVEGLWWAQEWYRDGGLIDQVAAEARKLGEPLPNKPGEPGEPSAP